MKKGWIHARLAQSVERWTLNPTVVGSSPTLGECFLYPFCEMTNKNSYVVGLEPGTNQLENIKSFVLDLKAL